MKTLGRLGTATGALLGATLLTVGLEAGVEHFVRADSKACLDYEDGTKMGQCLSSVDSHSAAEGVLHIVAIGEALSAGGLGLLSLRELGIRTAPRIPRRKH